MRRAQCYKSIGTVEALEEALRDYQQAQQMLGGDSSAGRDCERSIRYKVAVEESKTERLLQTSRGVREGYRGRNQKSVQKSPLKYHPDRQSRKSEAEKAIATKMFKDCAEGVEVLTDRNKRQMYDQGMDLEEINQGQKLALATATVAWVVWVG